MKKVVQREQHQQSEQFRKRLAERQKSKNNRSMSVNNQSLSLNFGGGGALRNLKDLGSGQNNGGDTESNNGMNSARRQFGESKIGMITKMNSSIYQYGGGGHHISSNDSFYSYGGKSGGASGGLASKISMALSRVVWNRNNSLGEDDDVADLMQLIEELNQHSDLTVKLNNQSKICKILETNDDFLAKAASTPAAQETKTPEEVKQDLGVREIMDKCKEELQRL